MGSRDWRSFVYGGLSSVAAEFGSLVFGTFPIDTTKTRLQVQGQAGDKKLSSLKYKGMIDAFVKISQEEGVSALYSGIWPAALRQAIYGTIKFGTYYSLKRFVTENEIFEKKSETDQESVGVNILCAALAGAISSAIANPTDVLKVRLQVKGTGDANIFRLFNEIYRQEGLRGLWRGVGPTAQRAVVLTAVELPMYDSCKTTFMSTIGDNVANHTISSFIASLAGAAASCPIDVIRTRLMNQKFIKKSNPNSPGPRIYKGSIDCAIQTVKHEGFMALYKGFIPTWMRMGPWNIIFFISYEELKKLY